MLVLGVLEQWAYGSRVCGTARLSNGHVFFFFQAEDGIRDRNVTGVQTCALPIWPGAGNVCAALLGRPRRQSLGGHLARSVAGRLVECDLCSADTEPEFYGEKRALAAMAGLSDRGGVQIGRASCRESGAISVVGVC